MEIALRFSSEKWINMSEYEKIVWLKQYLCTIKVLQTYAFELIYTISYKHYSSFILE